MAAISAALALASASSNIHVCRDSSSTPSPNGFSRLWLGPAAKPSSETEMSAVTLLMAGGRNRLRILDKSQGPLPIVPSHAREDSVGVRVGREGLETAFACRPAQPWRAAASTARA